MYIYKALCTYYIYILMYASLFCIYIYMYIQYRYVVAKLDYHGVRYVQRTASKDGAGGVYLQRRNRAVQRESLC